MCGFTDDAVLHSKAQYQAKALGLEDAPRVFVQHPISDQTPAQLHAKADAVFEKVRLCLIRL